MASECREMSREIENMVTESVDTKMQLLSKTQIFTLTDFREIPHPWRVSNVLML